MLRATFGAIAFFIIAANLSAAELANGIYPLVPDGQGTRVGRTSGGTIDLGKRVSDNFGDVTIWSLSNQNDHFRVKMDSAGPFDGRGHSAIYIDGVCEVIGSTSDPDPDGKLNILADIVGLENIEKVAGRLNAKPRLRKHPGHQLRVSWKQVKASDKIGGPVLLELEILNAGTTTIHFVAGGQQRGFRDNQFGFTAFASSGFGKALTDAGDPQNFGGHGSFHTLAPGEAFHKQVDITKWFKFEAEGMYQITGIYELRLQDGDAGAPVLWDEFATGRCLVRIEK